MKITGSTVPTVTPAAPASAAPVRTEAHEAPQAPAAALQSSVLTPGLDALRAMPELDAERVAALRDALARGELPFDPARLAGLVQKFHAGR